MDEFLRNNFGKARTLSDQRIFITKASLQHRRECKYRKLLSNTSFFLKPKKVSNKRQINLREAVFPSDWIPFTPINFNFLPTRD